MTKRNTFWRTLPALTCGCLIGLGLVLAQGQPPETNSASAHTNSAALKTNARETGKPALKHQLTGAELYSMHCNRCHPERYPTERTAAQWKTIMLHMQVRANIPAKQAELILKYLQDNSGR